MAEETKWRGKSTDARNQELSFECTDPLVMCYELISTNRKHSDTRCMVYASWASCDLTPFWHHPLTWLPPFSSHCKTPAVDTYNLRVPHTLLWFSDLLEQLTELKDRLPAYCKRMQLGKSQMEEVQRTGAGGMRSFLLSGSHPPHLYMLSSLEALRPGSSPNSFPWGCLWRFYYGSINGLNQGPLVISLISSPSKRGPLEEGMTNHFSILALRTPWTVWKGKKIGHWKMNFPGW